MADAALEHLNHSAAIVPNRIRSIAQMPERGRAVCRGYVESITVLPFGDNASFSAVVTDLAAWQDPLRGLTARGEEAGQSDRDRHRARLIWMGQRMVPGIDAGVELTFEGMVRTVETLPTIYNPRYEIIGRPRENQ